MLIGAILLLTSLSLTVHGSPLMRRNVQPKIIPLNLLESSASVTAKTIEGDIRRSVDRLHHALDDYERNTGAPLSHTGTIAERSVRKRELGKNETLYPERSGTWWSAQIEVGSPPITVDVLLDTGSTDAWVASSLCTNKETCSTRLLYEPPNNGAAEGLFEIGYHDKSWVKGKIFRDTLDVAGKKVQNVAIGAGDIISDMGDIGAIFGLAFPATSRFSSGSGQIYSKHRPYTSFYDSMLDQKLVGGNFSFSYAQNQGEFYLDGWNPDLSKGDFAWLDLDLSEGEAPGFWNVKADAVKLNGEIVLGAQRVMVDTGTNYMLGPKQEVDRFYQCVKGAKPLNKSLWQVPCNQPDVAFMFGNRDFVIPGSIFVKHAPSGYDLDEGYCVGMFLGNEDLDGHWIMGQFALSNWYTTFDYKNRRVGFSTLRAGA